MTKVAVPGLAVLQTGLTALAAANGSLEVVALNHPRLFAIGMAAITVGFVLAFWGLVSKSVAELRLLVGLCLIAAAIVGTAYAAFVVPTASSSPVVNLEIVSGVTRPRLPRNTQRTAPARTTRDLDKSPV